MVERALLLSQLAKDMHKKAASNEHVAVKFNTEQVVAAMKEIQAETKAEEVGRKRAKRNNLVSTKCQQISHS